MELAMELAGKGIALPGVVALLFTASGLARRPGPGRAFLGGVLTPLAVAAGLWATWLALYGAPAWPPREAIQVLPWGALAGALLALACAGLRPTLRRWAGWGTVLTGLGVALGAGLCLRSLLAPARADWPLWALGTGAAWVAWLGLDELARLAGARAGAFAQALWAGGAAVVVTLGHTAAVGQLLGALAAAAGATFLVTLLPGGAGEPRAGALVAAPVVGLGLATAHSYADLSVAAALMVACAPLAGALLARWVGRRSRGAVLAVPPLFIAATLAVAAGLAEAAPPPPPADTLEDALDAGYDALEP